MGLDPYGSGTFAEHDFGQLTRSAARKRFADHDWGKGGEVIEFKRSTGIVALGVIPEKNGESIFGSWRGCTDATDQPVEGMGGDGGVGLSVEEAWACVEMHGPDTDYDNGGRRKEDLETTVVLRVSSVVEVSVLVSLPVVVDQCLGDVVHESHKVAVEGDWEEVAVDGMDFVQDPFVVQMQEHNSLWPR